ncbi:Serine/threonine-protein kinase StkP [Rubripirellula obstinata]|uniref:Serine/threonine-protein kinase StkP n=1 Tax=Rubripirellula obstinata TaxID=406547 RepID=A0A5B1CR85_9BACT|nr:WD40 repeat domain-containing serine/threonine protein kinase [Rubripirellula obstinata]KAA1261754.1 Serine/threonine-protein kinase StkP [Rubripirellula obstinata]
MLQRGQKFVPGYRLTEFLGRGQFGEVWRASAPGGVWTAVKFIDLSRGEGQKEFRAIKRIKEIDHPNLMNITAIWLLDDSGNVIPDNPELSDDTVDIDSIIDDNPSLLAPKNPATLVVAMPLGGKSLLDRMKELEKANRTGIPLDELLPYMEDCAKGLDFLNAPQHDLGEGKVSIQHCDIKPANIVTIGGSAVICDLGLAKLLQHRQVEATEAAAGTVGYMSPEAIRGKSSSNSDQYSLAVTYYHLRTGVLPIQGTSMFEAITAHREGKLTFDKVGQAEQDVLRHATKLHWEHRYPSCRAFVDALRESFREQPASAVNDAADCIFDTTELANEQTMNEVAALPTTPEANAVLGSDTALEALPSTPTKAHAAKKTSEYRMWRWIAAVAVTVLCAGGVWLKMSGTKEEAIQERTATLESAIEAIPRDLIEARRLFASVLSEDSSIGNLTPIVLDGFRRNVVHLWNPAPDTLIAFAFENAPAIVSLKDSKIALKAQALAPFDSVLFNPNAVDCFQSWVAAGHGTSVRIWDAGRATADPALFVELDPFKEEVTAVALGACSGDAILAVGSASGKIHLFVHVSGKWNRLVDWPIGNEIKMLSWDPSGQYLSTLDIEGNASIYKVEHLMAHHDDGTPQTFYKNPAANVRQLHWGPNTNVPALGVVHSGGSVTMVRMGESPEQVFRESVGINGSEIECGQVLINGSQLAMVVGLEDGSLLDVGKASVKQTTFSNQSISSLDVTDDGNWIAAGSIDGNLLFTKRELLGQYAAVAKDDGSEYSIEFVKIIEPSNLVVAGCSDGTIRGWSLDLLKLFGITHRDTTLQKIEDVNPEPPKSPSINSRT